MLILRPLIALIAVALLLSACGFTQEEEDEAKCDYYHDCKDGRPEPKCSFWGNCDKAESPNCSLYGNCHHDE